MIDPMTGNLSLAALREEALRDMRNDFRWLWDMSRSRSRRFLAAGYPGHVPEKTASRPPENPPTGEGAG